MTRQDEAAVKLSQAADRLFDEEHPDRVRWARARRWAGFYWQALGPCSCTTPHRGLRAKCRDFKLMDRVEQKLADHGLNGMLFGVMIGQGRPRGSKGIPQHRRRAVPSLSEREQEIFRFLQTQRAEVRESTGDAEQRERRARRVSRDAFGLDAAALRSIAERGDRRVTAPR